MINLYWGAYKDIQVEGFTLDGNDIFYITGYTKSGQKLSVATRCNPKNSKAVCKGVGRCLRRLPKRKFKSSKGITCIAQCDRWALRGLKRKKVRDFQLLKTSKARCAKTWKNLGDLEERGLMIFIRVNL